MRSMSVPASRSVLLAIAAALATPAQAIAQSSDLAVAEDLGEIIVTAQRRAESVQDVPAAVTALSAESLRDLRITSAASLGTVMAGIDVAQPYGEGTPAVFTVRGITANDYTPSQTRPIALYLDESIRAGAVFESVPFYDLERVEVLRGPQGSLYGRNASGGAVNIITAKPGFDTAGYLNAGYGNYSRREFEGAIQGALARDTVAARLAFTYAKDGGQTKNLSGLPDESQTDIAAARLSLLFTPADNLEALLRLHASRSKGANYGAIALNIDPAFTGGVDRTGLGYFENETNRRSSKSLKNRGLNLQVTWQPSDSLELRSITSFDRGSWLSFGDDDGLPIDYDETDYEVHGAKAFSQEVRLASKLSGPFNWQAGVSYARDSMDFIQRLRWWNDPSLGFTDPFGVGSPCCGFNFANSFHQKRSGSAGYLRIDFAATASLSAFASARYSRDKVSASDYDSVFGETIPGGVPSFANPFFSDQSISDKFRKTTFEAGLRWEIVEDVSAYASFKQGYRAGAVNGQAFFDPSEINTIAPEEVDSFEVGLKSRLLDRRLTLNLAAFRLRYKNQQFLNTDAATGLVTLQSAEKSTVSGLEFEFQARAADRLRFNGGVTWLDPQYDRAVVSGVSVADNQLIGAAKFSANLGVDLDVAAVADGKVTLHGDIAHQSRVFYDAFNLATTSQGAYTLANARLSWENPRYFISVWGQNLGNKKYISYALDLQGLLGFTYAVRGTPRTYGVQAGVRFGSSD